MKKSILRGVLGAFVLVVLMSSFVSAFYLPPVRELGQTIVDTFIDFFEPVLGALLGGEDFGGDFLFEKLLIFFIVLSLIFASLSKVPPFNTKKKRGMRWLVTIIISIFAIRYMKAEWVEFIFAQYGILGIVLTAVLPLILFLFFVHNFVGMRILRKILWVAFLVIYVGLWSTVESEFYSGVYFWTFLVAILLFVFDRKIGEYFILREGNERRSLLFTERIAELEKEFELINKSKLLGEDVKEREGDKIMAEIHRLQKLMHGGLGFSS